MKLSKIILSASLLLSFFSANAAETLNSETDVKVMDDLDRSIIKQKDNSIGGGFTYDSLTKGRSAWRGAFFDFEHRFAPRTKIYTNIQQTERFNLDDTQLMLGGYYPISESVTLNVEGTYSGTHKVIARDSILGSLQYSLGSGWLITGGLKHSDYNLGSTLQEFGVLEWYYKDYRTALTLTNTQSFGENTLGERFSFSKYYNDISFVTISLGNGREVDRSLNKKTFLDTKSIGINGRHWLNPNWAVTWALTEGYQGSAYNNTGVSLGLRHNF